jgi:hypothetical protein
MPSSEQERLAVIYQSFKDAFARRAKDLKDAQTAAQANAILKNVHDLELAYLTAAKQALDKNGPAIEAAYDKAVAAKTAVDEAYAAAKSLAKRIGLVGDLAGQLGDLVRKASGKP